VLAVSAAVPTYVVREEMLTAFGDHPWRLVFPLAAAAAVVATFAMAHAGAWPRALLGSSAVIVGLLTTMAAGLYPNVLPAHDGRPHGLTVDNAASGEYALTVALVWWSVGMAIVVAYFVFAYRLFLRPRAEGRLHGDGGG
jgi:cytochrome bd ubiquinol oxidase subunit II